MAVGRAGEASWRDFDRDVTFAGWRAAGEYRGALREAILQFKDGARMLARPLASLMLIAAGNSPAYACPSLVTYVPSTRRKIADRGYNPAALLAARVAGVLGRPLAAALRVTGKAADQDSVPGSMRWDNAEGSFGASAGVRLEGHVLLVDDVMTTGATCDGCSRLLLENGADSVSVLVAGRARLRRKDECFEKSPYRT